MKTIKVTINGQEHDVPLPEGYGTKDDFKAAIRSELESHFDGEFARRSNSLKTSVRGELLKDEGFAKELLAARGIDPDKKQEPVKPDTEEVQRLRKRWEDADLQPVKTQLEAEAALNKRVLDRILDAEIENAARAMGVKDELLVRIGGRTPAIVSQLRDAFVFDKDTAHHALRGKGDRLVSAEKPTDERPYAGPTDYLAQLKGDAQYATLFKTPEPQKGPSLRSTPSNPAADGKTVVDRNDPLAFGRNAELIASGKAVVSE